MRIRYLPFLNISLVFMLFVSLSGHVGAHRFAPSLLKIIEISEYTYNVVWKTPTEATSNVPLTPTWPAECDVQNEKPVVQEGTGTISSWVINCIRPGARGLIGREIGVTGLAENQASVIVMLSMNDGRHYQGLVNAESPRFSVPAQPDKPSVMTEYSKLGAEHIWEGADHLMFVFGLLLLVGGGSRLFWTITAFTLGHSVTLALITLGFFTYPVPLIEFAIALSIFLLALELAKKAQGTRKGGLSRRYPWSFAGGFGLLHGMGFAGALAEIGLPQGSVPLALLFFNIGIEVGQILFVVTVMTLSWLGSKVLAAASFGERIALSQNRLVIIPVYSIGGLSAMWCIERGLEVLG